MADACVFLMDTYDQPDIVNIGSGQEISIRDLALLIAEVVGFKGTILHDTSKPDGMMRKLLDTTRLNNLGWKSRISLREGLESTYQWYLQSLP